MKMVNKVLSMTLLLMIISKTPRQTHYCHHQHIPFVLQFYSRAGKLAAQLMNDLFHYNFHKYQLVYTEKYHCMFMCIIVQGIVQVNWVMHKHSLCWVICNYNKTCICKRTVVEQLSSVVTTTLLLPRSKAQLFNVLFKCNLQNKRTLSSVKFITN